MCAVDVEKTAVRADLPPDPVHHRLGVFADFRRRQLLGVGPGVLVRAVAPDEQIGFVPLRRIRVEILVVLVQRERLPVPPGNGGGGAQRFEPAARRRRRHDRRIFAVESGILPAVHQDDQIVHAVAMILFEQFGQLVEMAVPELQDHRTGDLRAVRRDRIRNGRQHLRQRVGERDGDGLLQRNGLPRRRSIMELRIGRPYCWISSNPRNTSRTAAYRPQRRGRRRSRGTRPGPCRASPCRAHRRASARRRVSACRSQPARPVPKRARDRACRRRATGRPAPGKPASASSSRKRAVHGLRRAPPA